MSRMRVFVVVLVCLFAGVALSLAQSTLEGEYISNPGWCPGIAGNIQVEHGTWHATPFALAVRGREFLLFHKEVLASTDDFRIYGSDVAAGVDPDAAVIPVLAQDGALLKFANAGVCPRPAMHPIDDGPHGCSGESSWNPRPANLQLWNGTFLAYTVNAVGVAVQGFHDQGHGSVAAHGPADMGGTMSATRDGAFFQWHKNVDNIYADWAVGQYQFVGKTGRPIFFSVDLAAVGLAGSSLNDRRASDVYQGMNPPAADQYGAIPRIASDIYVGGLDSSNILYAAGTRQWGTLNGWDVDAWTVLNPPGNGWYFSVTMGSAGAPGTAVAAEAVKGGDLFETAGGGTNALFRAEASLGLVAAATDNLDAVEVDQQKRVQGTNDTALAGVYDRPRQWFSLRSGSTYGVLAFGGAAVGPNDILQINANGDLVIAVAGGALGLGAGDDLDALAIVDSDGSNTLNPGDLIYYSLVAGSPALGAGSPADIRCQTLGGAACAGVTAAALGLLATDELDALDLRISETGNGACCHSAGTCTDSSTEAACVAGGGTFAGPETVCAATQCPSAPGACCASNGTCTEVSDRACLLLPGTFRGAGTTCAATVCQPAPGNDECTGAYAIPYDYVPGYEPPADNTYATIPPYYAPPDPPYSCHDHMVFAGEYGSGTIWYSYDVPPGPGPGRSLYLTPERAAQYYPGGGGAGDTRLALYYAPSGDCSTLVEVACADNAHQVSDDHDHALCDYAPLEYRDPAPGRYYVQVSTVYDVQRGNTYLSVYEDPVAATVPVPALSSWGLALMTLVLIGAGVILLRLHRRVAT